MNKNSEVKTEERVIDATGRPFGRVATEAADALRGKDSPFFERNRITGDRVSIINLSSVKISTKSKAQNKVYVSYSGYPGGKKKETQKKLINRRGYGEVMRRAVYGMLPSNKLRPRLMKRLTVSE